MKHETVKTGVIFALVAAIGLLDMMGTDLQIKVDKLRGEREVYKQRILELQSERDQLADRLGESCTSYCDYQRGE